MNKKTKLTFLVAAATALIVGGTACALATHSEPQSSQAATLSAPAAPSVVAEESSVAIPAQPSVSMKKVTTGSGQSTVTYYVADVILSTGTELQTAFAGGDYGAGEQDTSAIAEANNALFAVNGDYCLARDDGVIIRNGVLYRNVPVRTGLALYKDGNMAVYDETSVSAEELLAKGVWNTFSFGPALLIDGNLETNLDTAEVENNPKHPIQGNQPRTGIGLIAPNHFVFVVVDGRSPGYSRGVTLTEFAQIFQDLGCTVAYNLDGGGSSTMYYQGEVVNDPLGRDNERSVSDILYVALTS